MSLVAILILLGINAVIRISLLIFILLINVAIFIIFVIGQEKRCSNSM